MIGRYGPPLFQILRGIEGAYNVALMKAEAIPELIQNDYLYYLLQDGVLLHFLESLSDRTCGQDGVNMYELNNYLILIPPYNEQTRIIKKIEETLPIINNLAENINDLSTYVKFAKSKILDLAIHGKLVPQAPNDEPAEELLKRIATSDNRPYKKLDEEDSSLKLPNGWTLCKLKDICSDFIVPQRDKPKSFDGTIPWCRIEDIEGKYLNGSLSGQLVTEETIKEMNMHKCPVGSIICSCSASLGVQAITTVECCTNQTFIGIVPRSSVLFNEYLYYLLKSQTKYFHEIATGTTIKYISRDKFEELIVFLPPIQEQHRIVAKIEELYSQLDIISSNLE